MSQFKKDALIIFESDVYKNRFAKSKICGRIKSVKGDIADIILYGMVGPGDETLLEGVPLEKLSLDNVEELDCPCYEIKDKINAMYPNADWNGDEACKKWNSPFMKELLPEPDLPIAFDEFADENYACTCPACGRIICGWCV